MTQMNLPTQQKQTHRIENRLAKGSGSWEKDGVGGWGEQI